MDSLMYHRFLLEVSTFYIYDIHRFFSTVVLWCSIRFLLCSSQLPTHYILRLLTSVDSLMGFKVLNGNWRLSTVITFVRFFPLCRSSEYHGGFSSEWSICHTHYLIRFLTTVDSLVFNEVSVGTSSSHIPKGFSRCGFSIYEQAWIVTESLPTILTFVGLFLCMELLLDHETFAHNERFSTLDIHRASPHCGVLCVVNEVSVRTRLPQSLHCRNSLQCGTSDVKWGSFSKWKLSHIHYIHRATPIVESLIVQKR